MQSVQHFREAQSHKQFLYKKQNFDPFFRHYLSREDKRSSRLRHHMHKVCTKFNLPMGDSSQWVTAERISFIDSLFADKTLKHQYIDSYLLELKTNFIHTLHRQNPDLYISAVTLDLLWKWLFSDFPSMSLLHQRQQFLFHLYTHRMSNMKPDIAQPGVVNVKMGKSGANKSLEKFRVLPQTNLFQSLDGKKIKKTLDELLRST